MRKFIKKVDKASDNFIRSHWLYSSKVIREWLLEDTFADKLELCCWICLKLSKVSCWCCFGALIMFKFLLEGWKELKQLPLCTTEGLTVSFFSIIYDIVANPSRCTFHRYLRSGNRKFNYSSFMSIRQPRFTLQVFL